MLTNEKTLLVEKVENGHVKPWPISSESDVEKSYPHAYRRKTRCELLRMCIGVVGIDFCYAAETAFVSPTMLLLHVPVTYMTWIWAIPPILGMIFSPLLGSLSDRCRSPLGRRRPFILSMTVGVLLGLLLMPNGYSLGQLLGDKCNPFQGDVNPHCDTHFDDTLNNSSVAKMNTTVNTSDSNLLQNNSKCPFENSIPSDSADGSHTHNVICPIGIALTVIGVLFMDFSCDGSQSPFRTYVIDLCTESDQIRGLTTFTIVSGIGGCAGYLIGGVDWEEVTGNYNFITQLRVVFGIALVVHLICVVFAVTSFREIPLDQLEAERRRKVSARTDDGWEVDGEEHEKEELVPGNGDTDNCGVVQNNITCSDGDGRTSFLTYAKSIVFLPRPILWLCASNFFLWMSMSCYALFFTDFVGQSVYGGSPSAPKGSEANNLYWQGVRIGSFGMAMYAAASSIYSLFVERIVAKFGTRAVYVLGPIVSIIGTVVIAAGRNVIVVLLFSPTMGMTYATLFTMPYIVITQYHEQGMFNDTSRPRGLGTDVALVTSMLLLAQFVLALGMGALITATGSTITIMATSAITGFIGVVLASQITFLEPKTIEKLLLE